jgi:hypothetical protein
VNDLIDWMKRERAKLSRHNEVAKAMDYMLKRTDGFTRFLEDGRICLSNNAADRHKNIGTAVIRAMKPYPRFVLKNLTRPPGMPLIRFSRGFPLGAAVKNSISFMSRPRKAMSEWVVHCEVNQRHVRRSQPTREAALKDAVRNCSKVMPLIASWVRIRPSLRSK